MMSCGSSLNLNKQEDLQGQIEVNMEHLTALSYPLTQQKSKKEGVA